MKFYQVIAMTAKADAPSLKEGKYEQLIREAADYFNSRSRAATNPKEILEAKVLDSKSLRIVFASRDTLNLAQASRSLRLFSMYLIDTSRPVNLSAYVAGKRLFRMEPRELDVAPEGLGTPEPVPLDAVTLEPEPLVDGLALVGRLAGLLRETERDPAARAVAVKIEKIIVKWEENHHAV